MAHFFHSMTTINRLVFSKHISPDRERETVSASSDRWDCGILEDEEGQRFQFPKYYRRDHGEIRPALRGEAIWSGGSILLGYAVGFTFL